MDGRTDDADRGRCSIIDDRDDDDEAEEVELANPIKCCIQESSKVRTSLQLSAKRDGRRTKLEYFYNFTNEMGHLTRPASALFSRQPPPPPSMRISIKQ